MHTKKIDFVTLKTQMYTLLNMPQKLNFIT